MNLCTRIVFLFFCLLSSACSTYHFKVDKPLSLMEAGQYSQASSLLKKDAFTPHSDQLAYLLEYALIKQLEGDFVESNKAFHLADRLSDVKDYISIKNQAASVVFSESMVAYKGDDHEKMLINMFSALNYASLQNLESALVEVRRLNEKLLNYKDKSGRNYPDNPLALYLSAVLWEKQASYDDACIDYKKVFKLQPSYSGIRDDLLYCSYKSRRWKELARWKKEFGISSYGKKDANYRDLSSELLLVVHQGRGPKKVPNPVWHRVPVLVPRYNSIKNVQIKLGEGLDAKYYVSEELVNLERLAIESLREQYTGIMAKRIAARIAKEQIAQRIEKNNEGLALLARIAMDVTDQADLRQWSSLPRSLQLVRIPLSEGHHKLEINYTNESSLSMATEFIEVDIAKGELKVLIVKASSGLGNVVGKKKPR